MSDLARRIAELTPEKRKLLSQKLQKKLLSQQLQDNKEVFSQAQILPQKRESNIFPLSFAQRRLWFLQQLEPQSAFYNIPSALRLTGKLRVDALERSLAVVVQRHEVLRTTFPMQQGQPFQVVSPSLPIYVPVIDLHGISTDRLDSQINALARAEAQYPFDLANGPLLRVCLLRLGKEAAVGTCRGCGLSLPACACPDTTPTTAPREHVLLFTLHHIISDGWSIGIFLREIAPLYQAQINGEDGSKPPSYVLPALPIQYADYTLWQREWLQGTMMESQLAYWREQLAGAPALLELPTDRLRPAVQRYEGARKSLLVSPELLAQLKSLSQRESVTLFMTLLATFQVLLMRYSGKTDIVVGTPIANRTREELEGLIGFFANTLVQRTDLSGNPSFLQLLARVREVALQAYAHQDVPFEKLVEELKPERDLSLQPLFQVLFSLDNAPLPQLELAELSFRPMSVERHTAKFDLSLILNEEEAGLQTVVEYSTDLFEDATITRLLGHWQILLETIAHDPEQNIETLPLLTEAERELVACGLAPLVGQGTAPAAPPPGPTVQWSATQTHISPDLCLHQLVEQQVEQTPDAVALIFEEQQLTYQRLNCQANQLAYHLREIGIGPDCLVGVYMERSLELVVALLAVLKSGGAYVPLDPEFPQERLTFMLEDAQIPVVLIQAHLHDPMRLIGSRAGAVGTGLAPVPTAPKMIYVELEASSSSPEHTGNPNCPVQPDNLAYLIYTSGSTGKPKGAMNTHRGLYNRLVWMQNTYQLTSSDRVLQKTPSSFDVSVWEFFWPLMTGASLIVARPEGHRDPSYLRTIIAEQQVTTLHFVPSMLQAFLLSNPDLENCTSLRQVICSGEALTPSLQANFFAHVAEDVTLHNLYGPTEAAIDVTFWQCQRRDSARFLSNHQGKPDGHGSVPIGRPITNTQIYLLDRNLQPVPIGVAGELYISGVALARGYCRRPELTAARFIPNPFVGIVQTCGTRHTGYNATDLHTGRTGASPVHSTYPGTRLYRTGDLARYRSDGTLEHLGRIDQQVKLRGFRIELGEIEATLQAHPSVQEAVVILREDSSLWAGPTGARKYLVAYVTRAASPLSVQDRESLVSEAEVQEATLLGYLREHLPDYMVPTNVVFLEALPLTPNGKVDRKALGQAQDTVPTTSGRRNLTFVAPRDPVERTLAVIWEQVLGVGTQVGIHDNFFVLGGDSILSMLVIARARQAGLGKLTLKQIFQYQTIAQLARVAGPLEQADELRSEADFPLASLDQVTLDRLLAGRENLIEDIYPLTPLQQGLLFHTLSEPRSGVYIEQVSYTLRGEVEVEAFKRAWQQVIARHMILRTAFVWQELHEPLQIVFKQVKLPLNILDWHSLPPQQQEADLEAFLLADRAEGLDVEQVPLMRLTLIRLSETRAQAVWTYHHLLLDGWSLSLVLQEVLACYEAEVQGECLVLEERRPYRDYISWLAEQESETAEAYWRQALAGITAPTPLGVDRRGTGGLAPQGYAEEILHISEDTTEKWQNYAKNQHLTLNTLIQAAWALVLSRYSGQSDVVFGIVVAGRPPELVGVEHMVGLFINTMPMRVQVQDEEEVGAWLTRLQEQQIEQRAYEYSSLVQVQEWSEVSREHLVGSGLAPDHRLLFESLLAFENYPVQAALAERQTAVAGKPRPYKPHRLEVEANRAVEQTNYPLTIIVGPGTELSLQVIYDRQRFERVTIQRLQGHFQAILQQLAADPGQKLATISLLTEMEREQILAQGTGPTVARNATRADYPREVCVHQLFELQIKQTPDSVALAFGEDEVLTYAELNRRANQLAHYLQSLGVSPDVLVGIYMERSIEMIVGILGVLKAGGAYVPLDPAYPGERLTFMIQDAQVALLLTQEHLGAQLPAVDAPIFCLDSNWLLIAQQPQENLHDPVEAENLAYVIYTSGSTGQPKGVLNKHRSLVNLCFALRTFFAHPEVRHVSLITSISFDISVNQIFPTLAFGKTLYIIPEEIKLDAQLFLTFMQEHMLHLLDCVPSYLDHLLATLSGHTIANQVVYILVGGEKLERSLLQQTFTQLGPSTVVVNIYGLTEIDDISTLLPISVEQLSQPITIGRPIQNTQVYILDAFYNPLPIGVVGELFIAGEGLARGYLKQPARTAEKFVPNPFGLGKLMCKTGDLARWSENGQIELLGRIDHQIKLHGFRIELGEIEATLQAHPAVQEAVVVLREERQDKDKTQPLQLLSAKKYLIAYVVPAAASLEAPDLEFFTAVGVGAASALQGYLREQLPEYMVPTSVVFLETMPLTPNGKVDRKALPSPSEHSHHESTFVAPREPVEQTLAAIWQRVLGRGTQVGIHDNFFALGGDSILSLQIIARARQAGLELTSKQIFQHQTIAQLAMVAGPLEPVGSRVGASPVPTAPDRWQQAEVIGPVLLTPIQHWFFEQDLPQSQHFNQSVMLQVPATWQRQRLQQVVDAWLIHHDALRLRYEYTEVGWQQRLVSVAEAGRITISHVDLTQIKASEQARTIEDEASRVQASLDLKLGPLLRMVLFELGHGRASRLFIVIHHLAVDGVSWRVLLSDMQMIMEGVSSFTTLRKGEPTIGDRALLTTATQTVSFQHWAEHLQVLAQSALLRKEQAYWLRVAQASTAPLPIEQAHRLHDCRSESCNTQAWARTVSIALTKEETQLLLHEAPRPYRSHIQELLLVTLVQTLARWMGTQTIRLDMEGHGREELGAETPDVSHTVGWFTSLYPVLFTLPQGGGIGESIKAIKEQLRSVPHKGISYGLLRYLCEDRELREQLASAPSSQVCFNYLGRFDQVLMSTSETSQALQTAPESSGHASGQQNPRRYLLDVNALVIGEQLHLQWTYSEQLHRQATIERLAQEFLQALRDLLAHCLSPEAGGFTPSDFPLAHLDQATLDSLLAACSHQACPDGVEDLYPLTPLQQGLLFHTLSAPRSGVYIEQVSCTLRGELAVDAFERAWQQLIMRHAILRTAFVWQELSEPLQIVFRQVKLPLDILDWRSRSIQQQEADLETFLYADRAQDFELDHPPLMRLTLVQLSKTHTQVIWTHHHLLLDGWSLSLLLQEVLACYEAEMQGQIPVNEERRPYRDYISWLAEQESEAAETYWRQALAGIAAPTPLGVDQSIREHGSDQIYAKETLQVEAVMMARWQEYIRREHVTLNTLVQAAWALVLSRYSGQEDVVFGTVVAGRPPELAGVERMIGLFINTVPVRVQVYDHEEVGVWLRRLQEQQAEQRSYEYSSLAQVQGWCYSHRACPDGRTGASWPGQEMGASPIPTLPTSPHYPDGVQRDLELFESLFVFENYPVQAALTERVGASPALGVEGFQIVEQTNYPLTIGVEPGVDREQNGELLIAPQPLHLEVSYDRQRFERATIQRLLRHLHWVLQQLVADPRQQLAAISLHTEEEREQLLVQWNATDETCRDRVGTRHDPYSLYPLDLCLHQLFEQQVEQTPDAIAVAFEDTSLTYWELNSQTNYLAHRLLGEEVGPDVLVGVCMERSLELVVALLAVLKAGGAYVPLDPNYPQERLTFMLEDAQVPIVLTHAHLHDRLTPFEIKTICVEPDASIETSPTIGAVGTVPCACPMATAHASQNRDNPPCWVQPENLAYLIYTSGSTGKPKGVMVTHRSISNNMHWRQSVFQLKPGDSIVQRTPLSFDVSVGELFFPLTSGARVIMTRPEGHKDSAYLLKLAAEQQATLLDLVPSLLQACVEEPALEQCLNLRYVLCGAEALSTELQERFFASHHADLWNLYGPSEATIEVTYWACERENAQDIVPIGRPIANTQIYLLDRNLEPVPIGVAGEVYVGGMALARGYVNRPDLTAELFVPHPWNFIPGERLYRTGDLARYRADGVIEYLGRIDQQIKLRGVRIEPGEIEAVLLQYPAVHEATVLVQEETPENKRLIAYLVLQPEQEQVELWPSVGEYPVYDEHIYSEMTHDEARNTLYKAALEQIVADKIVVDVGTGRNAILARLCVEAGAKRVYAIELMEESYQHAQAWVNRLGMQEQIKVLHGDATQVQLPEQAEVCVSEIFGAIGGAEGAGVILNSIGHLLTPQAAVVPRRSLTKIAAVRLPDELREQPAFTEVSSQYVSQVFEQVGHPFDLRLCIMNFPLSHLISDAEIFEDLDYTGQAEPEYSRQVRLTITKQTQLDGFLLWLILDLAPGQTLDILQGRYSWLPVYFPVLSPGIEVDAGDVIEMVCQGILSDNGVNPDYRIHGRVVRQNREAVTFAWTSSHHQPSYKQTDFYQRLFGEDDIPIRKKSHQRQGLEVIREHIRAYLPEPMQPSSFVLLERLPRLPNGKLDHRALPTIDQNRLELSATDFVPRTPVEEVLVSIWAQVLKLERVGVHENFFELGGHSLLATRLMARVRAAFAVEMPLRAVFKAPTIAALARQVEQALHKGEVIQIPPLVRMERPEQIPLSFAQERLWFLDQWAPGSAWYNVPIALRLSGPLHVQALEQGFTTVVERHEVLRTIFDERSGRPVQVIASKLPIQMPVIDLRGLTAVERDQQVTQLVRTEVLRPFDLVKGPLLRVYLLQLEEQEHVLSFILHHIVTDGWSIGVLVSEISTLYQAHVNGEPIKLSELPLQYADYALWQRQWLQGSILDAHIAYWKRQLTGAPAQLKLPTDRPRPAISSSDGASLDISVSSELTNKLKALSQREEVTLFMTLLTAFQVLLSRYTGQEDIVVGTDVANRTWAGVEELIGFFVNQLVLRTNLSGNPTFLEVLQQVKQMTLEAYTYQDLPFEKLVEVLNPKRSVQYAPLFQVKINFQQDVLRSLRLSEAPPTGPLGFHMSPLKLETTLAKLDLELSLSECETGITGAFVYSTALFDNTTIKRLSDHFEALLENVVKNPEIGISAIEILTQGEKEQKSMEDSKRMASSLSALKQIKPKPVSLRWENLITTTYFQPNQHLPLIVQPKSRGLDLVEWVKHNVPFVETELLKHGGILFRGFEVRSPLEFEQLALALCPHLFNENGEHPREAVSKNVYTPVFYPKDQKLLWHNENSFNATWPSKIWFYCGKPAERGGETPIVDNRSVFQQIDVSIREHFMRKNIMYVRNYGDGLGLPWQTVFRTTNKAEVEDTCRKAEIEFEWKDGDRLRTRQIRPAVLKHPQTGELVWWNQATHWHTACLEPGVRASLFDLYREEDLPRSCYYGDGLPIEDAVMEAICQVYQQAEICFPWQPGDILMLDNMLTAHARNAYQGERKIYVVMGDMISLHDVEKI
jgi:amino acid adenylation domain-containing protein/non-ribosomal peptide synthase protein (TIGR01720 family)